MTINCACCNLEMIIDEPNGEGYITDEMGVIHCLKCQGKCAVCETHKCMK